MKRLRRFFTTLCAAALGMTLATGCSLKKEESMTQTILPTEEHVKLLGRTYLADDTCWLAFSGTGIAFTYTGKSLSLTLAGDGAATTADNEANYARIAIYVDGERMVDEQLREAEHTYTAFTADTARSVDVSVVKLSECANSTVGIRPISIASGESISPAAAKAHKIEFIGDSITCGYGVDDEDRNHHFSTATEDVTKAYAYRTAQALNADYSMVSISGYGIISGYTTTSAPQSKQIIPRYYDNLGFSYQQFGGKTKPSALDWDYTRFQPEAVVVNLGTNDASYCKTEETQLEFTTAYTEFLKTIRAANPNARIFCTLGVMGNALLPCIQTAVTNYTAETGDTQVSVFEFAQQSEADGIAADWHPTAATHEKAAAALTAELQKVMGW